MFYHSVGVGWRVHLLYPLNLISGFPYMHGAAHPLLSQRFRLASLEHPPLVWGPPAGPHVPAHPGLSKSYLNVPPKGDQNKK